GSGAQKVTGATRCTAAAVTCTPAEVGVAQPTSCAATVSDASTLGSPIAPSGTITFSSSSGSFGSATCGLAPVAAGQSSCSVAFSPSGLGDHAVDAAYGRSRAPAPR